MSFKRCIICLDWMHDENCVSDVFKICEQAYLKIMNYNDNYHIIEFDVRDNFNFQCNAKIKGTFSIIDDEHYQDVCLTVKRQNLSYNIYHSYGHFLQKYIFDKQKIQNVYQEYLEKSDVFDLPNDCSIIENECIPQLIAHYFLDQLNSQDKTFVQEKILK